MQKPKRTRSKKPRNGAGLTARQLQTVRDIARERGLELPESYAADGTYCAALLDCLAIDRQQRPLVEVVRFVNNVTREVEDGATPLDLQDKHGLPAAFALTMHRYALKQLGPAAGEEWVSDLERVNRLLVEDDAVV